MVGALETIGRRTASPGQRGELVWQARLVEAESLPGTAIAWGKRRVSRRCAELIASLEGPPH
jgi:hypothetical protein